MYQNVIIVIPAINPDERLKHIISNLLNEAGIERVIVVDDGSDYDKKKYFPAASERVILLIQDINKGKGQAIKTAIDYINKNCANCDVVVTADADGQHIESDILKVAENCLKTGSFTLGTRDFTDPNVPLKSKIGNNLMKIVMRLFTGHRISDTQTGLRAIPKSLFDYASKVKGDRFEYETNFLLNLPTLTGRSNKKIRIDEIPIQTVYYNANSGTHYRAIADSLKIFLLFLKFSAVSLLSALADNLIFWIVLHSGGTITMSFVTARVLSSIFNFTANRKVIFKNSDNLFSTAVKYYILALCTLLASSTSLRLLNGIIKLDSSFLITALKIGIDTVVFFASFIIQKKFVFNSHSDKE